MTKSKSNKENQFTNAAPEVSKLNKENQALNEKNRKYQNKLDNAMKLMEKYQEEINKSVFELDLYKNQVNRLSNLTKSQEKVISYLNVNKSQEGSEIYDQEDGNYEEEQDTMKEGYTYEYQEEQPEAESEYYQQECVDEEGEESETYHRTGYIGHPEDQYQYYEHQQYERVPTDYRSHHM